ncbi:MAG: M1 family aminopeptidase [Rhodocyclaceae bacterium]|nr:M1 family aminopeptidase [Rhodocyclaceae bacterium]
MKRLFVLLLWLPLMAWALPRLELDVQLDPATRQFSVTATLTDDQDLRGFRLGPEFEIAALKVNGLPSPLARRPASADFRLPAGARRVEVAYRSTLAATPTLDHRQVLGQRAGTAAPEGSFLPGAALWYPEPGARFSYRLVLKLPAGQKGLVPGNLVDETDTAAGYRAVFDFPHPADGIDLMAGPYDVSERSLKLAGGRTIRIRTWFHPELAALAQGYLDDSARYIERYSKLIGDYPFEMFSVVSSPTPTGFGMPSLTYLGREVLKLPFIRATSLGHEVLHNWWGNGVYPDWEKGNWSEGLTTFLADYAYKEDEGAAAARDMRLGWLRDYAAVPAGADTALKDFTSRHHGIASIIGYNKAAMVFLMLRDRIGTAAFERGLRLLWERKRFQTASWADLEAAFTTASGQALADFFKQWVDRAETPKYTAPDPDYRVWRRIDPALLPPILREVFVAPQAGIVVTDADPDVRAAALSLGARVLDARPASASNNGPPRSQPRLAAPHRGAGVGLGRPSADFELPDSGAVLVIGLDPAVDAWLVRHGRPARPDEVKGRGTAQVWAGRDDQGRPYAVIAARDAAALKALERGLPHYGKQSWLVFDNARVVEKGVWPPRADTAPVSGAR